MMTIEVFTDRPLAHRQELADRLLLELTSHEGVPESVLAGVRALTHVLVHEPVAWATGGGDAVRYAVRLTVPGSWNGERFSEHAIGVVTDVIASFEDDPTRLRQEPRCVVQVVGLPEHGLGTLGRVTTSTELTRMMTEGYRRSAEPREAPAGSVIDPVCGMTVDLATATSTLTHDGTTYGFCAPVCRTVFAEEHGIAV